MSKDVSYFMYQPTVMNRLHLAATQRNDLDFVNISTAAGAAAMDAFLLSSVRVFSVVRVCMSWRSQALASHPHAPSVAAGAQSRAPIEAGLLGLDDGDLFGARLDSLGYTLLRRDAFTGDLLSRVGITSSGARDESNVIGSPEPCK